MGRILLYTKDVMLITGKSERASRTLIRQIRNFLGKRPHEVLTIAEFCEVKGIRPIDLPELR